MGEVWEHVEGGEHNSAVEMIFPANMNKAKHTSGWRNEQV